MADPALRLPENVPGDFYVDSTCIDCDACRIFAPTVFSDARDQSFVFHQPEIDDVGQLISAFCAASSSSSDSG